MKLSISILGGLCLTCLGARPGASQLDRSPAFRLAAIREPTGRDATRRSEPAVDLLAFRLSAAAQSPAPGLPAQRRASGGAFPAATRGETGDATGGPNRYGRRRASAHPVDRGFPSLRISFIGCG